MGKGFKFIIVGLLILLSVCIFFLLQLFRERQSLQQNYNEIKEKLNTQTSTLSAQASNLKEEKDRLQSKISQLEKDLASIKTERDGFQSRFDVLSKEKDELVEKLQAMAATKKEAPPVVSEQPVQPRVVDSDEYWAGVLKAKADLELQLTDLKSVVSDLQLKLDQIGKEKNDLTLQVSKLEQENQESARKASYNERLASNLSAELLREQKDKKEILEQLVSIKQENLSLRSSIKEINSSNFALKNKLKSIDEQRAQLDVRVEQMNASLEQKIDEVAKATKDIRSLPGAGDKPTISSQAETLAKNVELPPIVVKGEEAVNDLKIISGKVIALNDANNFVVINLGENQGLSIGRKLDVYRNNVSIGRIEVVQTRKNISAADIIKLDPKRKIKVGDIVR